MRLKRPLRIEFFKRYSNGEKILVGSANVVLPTSIVVCEACDGFGYKTDISCASPGAIQVQHIPCPVCRKAGTYQP